MSILKVKDLRVSFDTVLGRADAVRGVSFSVNPGETLGIVGESGSGKSVTSLAVMGLLDRQRAKIDSGEILFHDQNLLAWNEKQLCKLRGSKMSMIFQEPMTALDPVVRVYRQLREVYCIHVPEKKNSCRSELRALLEKLNIPDADAVLDKYPFELSGGMKQRVMIAMAMICRPELLIADEPTTALDVTTQAEILRLLQKLQKETGCAILLITHDLGVIANMADRVAVMYRGKIVETAPVLEFFDHARHPYAQDLLAARPEHFDGRFRAIPGAVPSVYREIPGCAYRERCSRAMDYCGEGTPPETHCSPEHTVCCRLYEEGQHEIQ